MNWLSKLRRQKRQLPDAVDMTTFQPSPPSGYLVGGAVRDTLLQRPLKDLDWLVPDAREAALEVADRLQAAVFPLDEERGHWRVLHRSTDAHAGTTIDFIELRGPLEEDLRARDFTINAMALDLAGQLIDPTGGRADLEAGQVRMTSSQALRDDPLRMLRAVRFSNVLQFRLERATKATVAGLSGELRRGTLKLPAWERIREELDALIRTPHPGRAFLDLDELGLLELLLPELTAGRGMSQGGFHHQDVLGHSLEALERVATAFPESDGTLRWATLLHDVGKPVTRDDTGEDNRIRFYGHDKEGALIAGRIMRRLRKPQEEVQQVSGLVRYHMLPLPKSDKEARRFVHRRRPLLPDLLMLMIADREAARGPLSSEATRRAYRLALARIIRLLEEPAPPQPLLRGQEVIEHLGLEPGPRVGEALRLVEEARAVGDVNDREEALQLLDSYAAAQGWNRNEE